MHVPTESRAVLSRPSPMKGDPAAIAQARSFVSDTAGRSGEFRRSLRDASSSLGASRSRATERLDTKISETLQRGATSLERSARDAEAGFGAYATAVDRIHRAARRISDRVERRLAEIRIHASTITEICDAINVAGPAAWTSPPSSTMPEPGEAALDGASTAAERCRHQHLLETTYAAEWWRAATGWRSAYDEIRSERIAWDALIDERRGAERTLLGALSASELGHAITLGAAPGSSGVTYAIAHTVTGELWGKPTGAPAGPAALLLRGAASPDDVARAWETLRASDIDADAFIEEYCFELAALDGLPFSVMDRAARTALAVALDRRSPENLHDAFARMGFRGNDRSLAAFETDLQAVRDALRDADELSHGGEVQLLDLGWHDGAVTAAISLGDLDAASTVSVFISGMRSDVRGLGEALDAFRKVRGQDERVAMVTWVGYRAPSLLEETVQFRADAGARELASFLDGIAAARAAPAERFVLMGHSYGTNVAAEALRLTDADIDAFVTLGSAGLKYGTTAADLDVSEIHATNARGDNIAAPIGQRLHFRGRSDGGGWYAKRVDPRTLAGARSFTSEQTSDGEAVTMHNLVDPIEWPTLPKLPLVPSVPLIGSIPFVEQLPQLLADTLDGVAAADEVGYLHVGSSTVNGIRDIVRNEWK